MRRRANRDGEIQKKKIGVQKMKEKTPKTKRSAIKFRRTAMHSGMNLKIQSLIINNLITQVVTF